MASRWIPLAIHPRHPKVLRVAALTGLSRQDVFCMAVNWFRYVDAEIDGPRTGMTVEAFHEACEFEGGRDR